MNKTTSFFEQKISLGCIIFGFGYTFQFSQMMKSTHAPRRVLFYCETPYPNKAKSYFIGS